MFGKKKVKNINRKAVLTIYFKDGTTPIQLIQGDYKGKSKIGNCKKFYKWWYSKESELYMIPYDSGVFNIIRSNISLIESKIMED
jgi:hypothetical protein